jgi:ABC-type multidrug transport system ATPase subunit
MTAAIEVSGIRKIFGTTEALIEIDLVAPAGRVLALLGPNGAGKTTLVRILTTLLRPDSGTAMVGGHGVRRNPAGVRSIIGLAGQYAAVDDLLTGRENVEMVGELYQLRRTPGSPVSQLTPIQKSNDSW